MEAARTLGCCFALERSVHFLLFFLFVVHFYFFHVRAQNEEEVQLRQRWLPTATRRIRTVFAACEGFFALFSTWLGESVHLKYFNRSNARLAREMDRGRASRELFGILTFCFGGCLVVNVIEGCKCPVQPSVFASQL